VGTEISLERIGYEYDLDKGAYELTANYRIISDDGTILQNYRSNTLRIVMRTGKGEHIKELEKGGEAIPIDLSALKKSHSENSKPDSSLHR